MKFDLTKIDIVVIKDGNNNMLEKFIPSKISVIKTNDKKVILEIK